MTSSTEHERPGSLDGRPIHRLLVANRGEIARRVFRTCRDLGIGTVAVHSDADAGLLFVAEADLAVRLPGHAPAETYLRGDLIVEAARRAGADAVHPGYGFLSEDPAFARRVIEAGLTWVGPTPASMEQMSSKVGAKQLMAAAGVPVLAELDPAQVTEADLPILVKASAGGGGRGMRVVRSVEALGDAVEQAAAEAVSAFGDGTVFCEPYVETGRHVEVQVWGDARGSVSILGERDCTLQRRHQKVVEEAPAAHLAPEVRARLHAAARTAAETLGYVGAGTVEFLFDEARADFWFLEMNTRLQVEHPVTEAVTGLDLVALQLAAAEGGRGRAIAVEPHGHAVEARLYAEDPTRDYAPQSGRLTRFEIPAAAATFVPTRHGVRVDSGFGAGDEIGTHYDAMIAKVVAWAPTRPEALRRLAAALAAAEIHGVRTNRDLLVAALRHPRMIDDVVDTGFLGGQVLDQLGDGSGSGNAEHAGVLLAAAVACAEEAAASRPVQQRVPTGWRNVVSAPQLTRFVVDGAQAAVEVRWQADRDGHRLAGYDGPVHDGQAHDGQAHDGQDAPPARTTAVTRQADHWRVVVEQAGIAGPHRVFVHGEQVDVEHPGGHLALHRVPRFTDPADRVAGGSLLAPMPGSVVRLAVAVGDQVAAGAPVLVLEAMKMQHTVSAPADGTVTELPVEVGAQVAAGAVVAVVESQANLGEPDE